MMIRKRGERDTGQIGMIFLVGQNRVKSNTQARIDSIENVNIPPRVGLSEDHISNTQLLMQNSLPIGFIIDVITSVISMEGMECKHEKVLRYFTACPNTLLHFALPYAMFCGIHRNIM